jgi:hypothetical protein
MVLVTITGLLMGGAIGGYRLNQWHNYFVARAQHHAKMEAGFRSFGGTLFVHSKHIRASASDSLSYHVAMAQKYRHAACFPWFSVAPDPQEPQWPPYELFPQSR